MLCQKGETYQRVLVLGPRKRKAGLPVDVEHADEGVLLDGGVQGLVDVLHNPAEELGVDVLGQGVPGVDHLLHGHALHVGLGRGDQLAVAKPVLHLALLHAQQAAEVVQVLVFALRASRRQEERGLTLPTQGLERRGHPLPTVPPARASQPENHPSASPLIGLRHIIPLTG